MDVKVFDNVILSSAEFSPSGIIQETGDPWRLQLRQNGLQRKVTHERMQFMLNALPLFFPRAFSMFKWQDKFFHCFSQTTSDNDVEKSLNDAIVIDDRIFRAWIEGFKRPSSRVQDPAKTVSTGNLNRKTVKKLRIGVKIS